MQIQFNNNRDSFFQSPFSYLSIDRSSQNNSTTDAPTGTSQATNQDSKQTTSERFATEMARRMAANPIKDQEGKIKDTKPLLDSIIKTVNNMDDKTANAARALLLQTTSTRFSLGSLVDGFGEISEYIDETQGEEKLQHIIYDDWRADLNKYLEPDSQSQDPNRVYGINYAMVKYFNLQVEINSSGTQARMPGFVDSHDVYSGKDRAIWDVAYAWVNEKDAILTHSNADNFSTAGIEDHLQNISDYFRENIGSDAAATYVENISDNGIFQSEMQNALSIIYNEKGEGALGSAVEYLNTNLVDIINNKIASQYTNDYGDKVVFNGWEVSPANEYFGTSVSYTWHSVRTLDGEVMGDGAGWGFMSTGYGQFQPKLQTKDDTESVDSASSLVATGILLDATA